MANERTRKFRFWCVNGEDEDMWVGLGLICRRFARLELREVEEDVCNLQQRQHLGWCDDDDKVVLVVQPGASSGESGLLRTGGEDGGDARFVGVNGGFAVIVEDDDNL
ncbi:hypothetical protein LR48_Vigan08g044700 [Vigna angularis]|uniref:Uncharacterized protein n=1 Tax=Phaseolus angularis TaxID=3914 RepID=A0A0L9V3H6_PHAAN|nr:hypothetical protein LR48_Vigan08g044700 [Vigna angularis]